MIKTIRQKFVRMDDNKLRCLCDLVCDNFEDLPGANDFNNMIIDFGSTAHVINTDEDYMLNSDGDWMLQKKTDIEGVTFTEADKAKLDSLTNPILLKGRVDTFDELPKEAVTGWLYFVGEESAMNFAEYIFTDSGEWEYIGDNSIDLSNYVKKTDYATADTGGVVKVLTSSTSNRGIYINSSTNQLTIAPATEAQVKEEEGQYKPIVPTLIPVMMSNYGITSKTLIQEILDRLDALENSQ